MKIMIRQRSKSKIRRKIRTDGLSLNLTLSLL